MCCSDKFTRTLEDAKKRTLLGVRSFQNGFNDTVMSDPYSLRVYRCCDVAKSSTITTTTTTTRRCTLPCSPNASLLFVFSPPFRFLCIFHRGQYRRKTVTTTPRRPPTSACLRPTTRASKQCVYRTTTGRYHLRAVTPISEGLVFSPTYNTAASSPPHAYTYLGVSMK